MSNTLAQRVDQQRNGALAANGSSDKEAPRTLAQQIERMTPEYQKAMPKGMEAVQLVRDALTCLRTVRDLDKCEPGSVLGALMTCAQLGLRPGLLGQAWPLPFWDKHSGGHKAQLVIGYQGYVELGYRSGRVTAITARTVHEADEFDVTYYADRDDMVHRPRWNNGERGEITHFYSTARLVNGGYAVTDPYSTEEMRAHRDEYAPRNREGKIVGVWGSNFEAMGLKTMVRVNYKLLPKSAEMAVAMDADEGVRVDLNPEANAAEVTRHDYIPGEVVREAAEEDASK
jgi:recombination protein RecT